MAGREGKLALRRGALALTAGTAVQAAVALGANLVLVRFLPPEDFGQFAIILASCGLVQMVLSLRLNVQIIRASDKALTEGQCDLYHSALCWETLAAFAVALAWLAWAGLMSPLSLALLAALAIGQWSNQMLAFFERSMAYRRMAAVETGTQLLGHALSVLLVLAGAGAAALYLRELAIVVLRLLAFAAIGAVRPRRWRVLSASEWWTLSREARDLWADGVVEGGFSRIVVLASGLAGGTHAAGIFSQALRLATVPHQLLAPLVGRMASNLFSRIEADRTRLRALVRLGLVVGLGLSACAAAAVLLADPLVPWLFGERWRAATGALVALAGVILFYSLFELVRAYCLSQRLTHLVLAGRLLQYAVFIGGALWAAGPVQTVETLGAALSLSWMAGFLVVSAGITLKARKSGR
jgi:O-antigen/teichoic acid export membrane protein